MHEQEVKELKLNYIALYYAKLLEKRVGDP
jgi:hypothetical protein